MTAGTPPIAHERLLADFDAGKKAALARAVSIVENHRRGFELLLATFHSRLGRARRIAHGRTLVHHQLRRVLVRHRQVQAVFSRFRQNSGKSVRDEVLEFVHIQVEVPAGIFRYAHEHPLA